jgi:hypothetical protein
MQIPLVYTAELFSAAEQFFLIAIAISPSHLLRMKMSQVGPQHLFPDLTYFNLWGQLGWVKQSRMHESKPK